MIEPRFVAEIIDFLLEQEVDKSAFLDENDRLKKEGLSNLLLAAECFVEVRNRNSIASTSSKLLKTLQREVEGQTLYPFNYELAMRLINTIASTWQDNSELLAWLKERALNDQNWAVRRVAVEAIGQGWKDDPDTLPWLKERALNDQDEYVRSAAVKAIGQGWKDDLQTFDFLCDRAIHDPFEREEDWQANPRQTALEAILKHYRDKPQTVDLLKAIAQNDSDEKLKKFAEEELAKIQR